MKLNQNGQTLVEYVLIISLVAIVVVALVNFFGGYLKDAITKTSCSISGKEYVESKHIGKSYCKGDEDRIVDNFD